MMRPPPSAVEEFPDPKICHTKPLEKVNLFAQCLVEDPINCPYVFDFGMGFLCKHTQWKDFVKA